MSTTIAVAIRKYAVVSPTWTYFYNQTAYGDIEPPEDVCAYIEVEAKNRRQAKSLAVKSREFRDWVDLQRSDERSPFTGLKCYPVDEVDDEGILEA